MGWKEGGIVQSGHTCCKKGIGFWCHKHRVELLCFALRRKAFMVHPTWFTRFISQCMQWSCDNNRLFAPTLNMAPRISIVRGSVTNVKHKNATGWSGQGDPIFNVLLKNESLNLQRGNRGGVRGVACQQNSSNLPITKNQSTKKRRCHPYNMVRHVVCDYTFLIGSKSLCGTSYSTCAAFWYVWPIQRQGGWVTGSVINVFV